MLLPVTPVVRQGETDLVAGIAVSKCRIVNHSASSCSAPLNFELVSTSGGNDVGESGIGGGDVGGDANGAAAEAPAMTLNLSLIHI